jgi:starch synthase (maltosyl-transferring)
LTEYFAELTGTEVAEYFRPNLFANTPDILHAYLQKGGPAAFKIRLILAATLGATYGIYSGFELNEGRAVTGSEEYLDSEKYQFRHWDWDDPGNLKDLIATINGIRRDNPALHFNEGLMFCPTDNPSLFAFCKRSPDRSNAILVIVNVDYDVMQHGFVSVPLDLLTLPQNTPYDVVDLLDGTSYSWRTERNYVRLDPDERVAHVLQLPVAAPAV